MRHWFGEAIGLASAGLVAISPFHVWYSQDARPYALLVLLALLSIRSAQHLLEQPRNVRWRAAFVLSTAAAFYTHTVSLALFAFLGAFVLLQVPRRDWPVWLVTGAVTIALCLPGARSLFLSPLDKSANPSYEFHPAHIGYALYAFAAGFSLGPSVAELHAPKPIRVALQYSSIVIPLVLVIGTLCVAGIIRIWRSNRPRFRLILLWLSLPLAFAVIGAMTTVHPFNVRYAIIAYPPFVVILVQGVWALGTARRRAIAGVALASISAWSLSQYFWNPKYSKENIRDAVVFIVDRADPGDLVIASAPYIVPVIEHYDDLDALRVVPYPQGGTGRVLSSALPTDMGWLASGRDRFWVLLSRTFHSDPEEFITSHLDRRFERRLSFSTTGVRVILYGRQSAGLPAGRSASRK